MKRADAYPILVQELKRWRILPKKELLGYVGQKPSPRAVRIGEEEVSVEVEVGWADDHQTRVCVTAIANGPSHWRLERLEEKITLRIAAEEEPIQPSETTRGK